MLCWPQFLNTSHQYFPIDLNAGITLIISVAVEMLAISLWERSSRHLCPNNEPTFKVTSIFACCHVDTKSVSTGPWILSLTPPINYFHETCYYAHVRSSVPPGCHLGLEREEVRSCLSQKTLESTVSLLRVRSHELNPSYLSAALIRCVEHPRQHTSSLCL